MEVKSRRHPPLNSEVEAYRDKVWQANPEAFAIRFLKAGGYEIIESPEDMKRTTESEVMQDERSRQEHRPQDLDNASPPVEAGGHSGDARLR